MPQVLPLSANRVTREGSGHLAMPPCGLPMVHQPIRFHIVLHEALRVARGEKKKGRQRERRNGGGCLIRCYWSIARDRVSAWWQSFQSWTHLFSIVFVFSSEATACLPESLRYFHSNVNFSITDHLAFLKRHWCSNLGRLKSNILHKQVISHVKSSPTSWIENNLTLRKTASIINIWWFDS